MWPLRRDGLLDHGVAREMVDRAVKFDIERDELRQRRLLVDAASGVQRRFEPVAAGRIGLHAFRGEAGGERVDRAADLIELADARGIELRHLEAAPAALGEQSLPMQQMQRVRHRLPRHPELFGELVLPDAMAGRQCAIRDRFQDTRIDLIGQVWSRIERDHANAPSEYGIPYSESYRGPERRSRSISSARTPSAVARRFLPPAPGPLVQAGKERRGEPSGPRG